MLELENTPMFWGSRHIIVPEVPRHSYHSLPFQHDDRHESIMLKSSSLGADDKDTLAPSNPTLRLLLSQGQHSSSHNSPWATHCTLCGIAFQANLSNVLSVIIETDALGHACEQSINSEGPESIPSTTATKMAAASCCNWESQMLPRDFTPSNYDVICLGRGKSAASHRGNRRYPIAIQLYHEVCLVQVNFEKSVIVSKIMDTVRENSLMGGSCNVIQKTGGWFEVGDSVAREKVGQALREFKAEEQ